MNGKMNYEYCPRCYANLTLQKGYRNDLPYWVCKGCGEMLINPDVDAPSDVAWICDGCGEMLNIQPGFHEECSEWTCTKCGFVNRIGESELYLSEDEYVVDLHNPYKGLSDQDALKLTYYEEIRRIDDRPDVILVKELESGSLFIKKYLSVYDKSVYEYLINHPIQHMPRIYAAYEGDNCLIVLEEYIAGSTIADLLDKSTIARTQAIEIAKSICGILMVLHNRPKPIIHRDIKPSNIIITSDNEAYLLDMNIAKWYDPQQTDDTRHMGTENYAAPEQVGYSFHASSDKSDIYALGVLLNVMITGDYPKQTKTDGPIWDIIKRCIDLDAEKRYTAKELLEALNALGE